MTLLLATSVRSLCIAAILHLTAVDLAVAQTSKAMKDAAAEANTGLFKPDPSDLYALSGSAVTIRNGSPAGDVTLDAQSLFFDVPGQSAGTGALPPVATYDDLYPYRDTRLGHLEMGTGGFSSTGTVQAESNAMSVLGTSQGIPSVSAEAFLLSSRNLLQNGPAIKGQFGECIITPQTSSVEYSYDSTQINTCDTLALDLSPMTAARSYNGPNPPFAFVTSGGQGYCRYGGRQVKAPDAATCAKLSVLDAIPVADRGTLSAQGCGGIDQCVELVLDQAGDPAGGLMSLKARSGIVLGLARVTGTNLDPKGHIAHSGTAILTGDGTVNIPAIVSNPANSHQIGVFGGTAIVKKREPAAGWEANTHAFYSFVEESSSTYGTSHRSHTLFWHGSTIAGKMSGGSLTSGACTYHLGPVYEKTYLGSRGGSENPVDMTEHRHWVYRVCDAPGNADGRAVLRLDYSPTPLFTPWGFNAARYSDLQLLTADPSCTLTYTVDETARNADSCVSTWAGGTGTPGRLCGAAIPVAPFAMLADRAATRLTVTPQCLKDPLGQSFTQSNSCAPLQNDPSCSFLGRTCSVTLADGRCAVHENRYGCGAVQTVKAPIVKQVNVCASNLSCLGDECILDTGTSGAVDLADTAAKLAAADMMMSDMDCADDLATAVDRDKAMLGCTLFQGKRETCSRRTLGLSNCCTTPSGVSVSDYLQLAFSISRLSRALEGTSLANPVTSSWVSLENTARNSFSEMSRPLTETWESIIGNSNAAKTVGNALSMEAIKQEMMKKAASWTAKVFGEQAANAIFRVGTGPAISQGALNTGTIGLTQTAATVMSAVMTAYTIYTLINVLSTVLFACTPEEQELMVRRALKSTHEVGEYCSRKILGHCVSRRTTFCMFNSPLSRIMNEQARKQLGIDWGTPTNTNCQGITVKQFQTLDMGKVDLSEWTGMIMTSGMIDFNAVSDIDRLTGTQSTYGKALEDLYTRQDAITRNAGRYQNVDTDAIRKDAGKDFGKEAVQ